jgi:hypothetical protein
MKKMERLGIIFSVLLICVTLFFAIQKGSFNSQNIQTMPDKKSDPSQTMIPTRDANPKTTTSFFLAHQTIQNPEVNQDGIVEYKSPEKIINPEDLQVGDLIQMPINNLAYDENRGLIIENISSQNNQFLVKEIVRLKTKVL